ncbi:hypothetical protein Pssp01_33870 [Pseudomonas sp. NBRC 100443]|nr:hypothetical protein Pssp01_33870 [Pseudomonas sp. NBRC 100443]
MRVGLRPSPPATRGAPAAKGRVLAGEEESLLVWGAAAVAAAILRRAPGTCLRLGCAPGALLLRCAHLRTDDEARP